MHAEDSRPLVSHRDLDHRRRAWIGIEMVKNSNRTSSMWRLLILAIVLLAAYSPGRHASAGAVEEDVLRSLRAKRLMRCPIAAGCNRDSPTSARDMTIAFASGSARLEGDAKSSIEKFVTHYRTEMPDRWPVTLSGYADGLGGEDYNRRLSRRRALAVRRALIDNHGFSPESIRMVAHGIRHAGSTIAAPEDRIVVMSAASRP
jgi:outer membrane protein OmpA-like peptidoglycan-associated protein